MRRRPAAAARHVVAVLAVLALTSACQSKPPEPIHTLIPRTGVSLLIPDEFRLTEDFPGLIASDRVSTVMINEVSQPFESMRAAMAPHALADRGLRTLRSEEVIVDGRAAQFVHAIEQRSSRGTIRHWMLVFGAGDFSVVLAASTTKELAPGIGPVIEDILLGALWDPRITSEIFSELGFTVTETESLKVSDRLPRMIVLTRGGHRDALAPDEPLVFAGSSETGIEPGDLAAFARLQLSEMPELEEIRIVSEGPVDLGDLIGHEIVATAVDRESNASLRVYQAFASDGARYYLVQGFVGAGEAEAYVPQFREIVESFERTPPAPRSPDHDPLEVQAQP